MTLALHGKTAFVTGASRGIGAATARYLAGHGAKVALAARSADPIQALAEQITANGGQAIALPCDVSDYDAVAAAVSRTVEHFGSLDILINNAGLIDPIARIADSDPAAWGQVADVNYKGTYHGLRATLPVMLEQGSGTVINISSGAATSALEGWSHYCSTKAAVLSLTRCADRETRAAGIRVIGLSPGTVATDMQEAIRASGINPVSQLDPSVHIPPEWVAQAIGFLCGPGGNAFLGTDFSLKTDEGRALAGLPAT
ncbi:SDR family oxidoreductase [Seohaeicola saemankumensis]|nr:SDR family oxidoreductase [Seohaeicola saemankumensis]MCA0871165.1 SDR family oxidoreductase [Seohaeicola saemankumensis]